MREKGDTSTPDRLIAAQAAEQHAVLDAAELRACGLTTSGIDRRLQTGRLHRKHRGVYAVGHPRLTQQGVWLAAVKACGPGAALSHQSAAALWSLLPDYRGPPHVTVQGPGGRRRREGIEVHRSRTLTRRDLMIRDAILVTNPARTIADLRRVLNTDRWEDALDKARSLHLPIPELGATAPTRSRLERRLLALCRRHRLPIPETNVRVGPFLVDFLWRQQRLIVETDGYEHHRDRAAFEADRARDAKLSLMGYTVIRITWRQITGDPGGVAATLRALLADRLAVPRG
jgi:very-short-patch-repair endonuclease